MVFTPLNIVSFVCFASWISTGYAQGTAATCGPGFDWMTNSREQSPCLVASWLYVPCYGPGAPSVVSKINPGVNYGGPNSTDPTQSTPCDCNTVLYSLRAACGQCQGGGALPWPQYTANCVRTYNGTYPETIPNGTAVPKWAYLALISDSTQFNLDAARALALQDLPDVTGNATGSPVSTSGPSRSTSATLVTASTGAGASTQHSNTGAIVGAAVGGVLGFLLLVTVMVYIIRRRKQIRTPDAPVSSQTVPVREVSISETSYRPLKGEGVSIIGHPVLYDPDDPRTYPAPIPEVWAPNNSGPPQISPA